MTNETNRMKTKVGRIGLHGMGKRTLSLVLGLVMLLTAFGSGSVLSAIAVEGNGASVLLDAAKAGASVDVADVAAADDEPLAKKTDSDIADTADNNPVVVKGSWDNWAEHAVGEYKVTLAADSTYSFVFNDNGTQYAANTTFSASQSDYYVTANDNASFTLKTTVAGEYTFTYEEISGGSLKFDLTFPAGSNTTTWTAVGDSTAIFGTAWAPTATANDLTKSGNTWSKTWNNVYLSSGTIQYKVAKNHAWGTTYPSDNATKKVSSTGYYNVTVSYNESTNAVDMTLTSVTTYSVTVPTVDNATVTVKSGAKSASEGGSLSGLLSGASVTVTVAPDAGYKIDSVSTTPSITVSGTGNTRYFTMGSANVTLNVTISKDTSAKKIYFNNNNAEYSMVSAYAEDSSGTALIGAKPGTTMTKLANSNIWVVEVPSTATKIMFTGDNGYNTGLLTIQSGTNPMYEAGFTKSSPKTNAPGWKTYTARTNEYTVSKGSTLNNNSNLFTGISATFYDYFTDGEAEAGNWIEGIKNTEYTWEHGDNDWNPYETLNKALSDYAASPTSDKVTYPLYFGNLNAWDMSSQSDKSVVEGYTNWVIHANNSIGLDPNTTAVQNLAGNKLANGTIRHYKSGATNLNGNDMAMFNEDFLSGWNSQNKTLATILRSASFPVRKEENVGKGISVSKLYLVPGAWAGNSATFDAYFWGDGFTQWKAFTDSGDTRVVDIPEGATGVKFIRRSSGHYESFDTNKWNETGDITLTTTGSEAKNVYTFDSWDANFTPSLDSTKAGYTNNTTGHTYYEYDSTNGKDNAFITNVSTTNKSAQINYYNNTNKVHSNSNTDGFFPFNRVGMVEGSGTSELSLNSNYAQDLGYGMKLEIPFTVGLNGKNDDNTPQTFDFSGDDDLWVYIDGELVLDLGGAHARTTGSINFNTKVATATTAVSVTTANTNDGTRYSGTTQTKSFSIDTSANGVNTPHTMTIYYMERGMYDSNLKFGFSFHAIPNQLKVEKKVRTANVNQGFYTLNERTTSDYTVDNGRSVTWFEKSYQYDDFSVNMTSGSAPKSSPVKYTMNQAPGSTQAGSTNVTATPTGSNNALNYTLRNDFTAYFMDQYNANTQFTLKEVANSHDLYNYDKSINVYDDANNGTEVSGTGNATDGYTFAFSETHSTGIENLNIRARFTNQMKTHNLVIKKATNNPTDTTTDFKLFVKVKADSTEYDPKGFVAYPLYCTVNGESAQLAADGSISIKAGQELIIQKIPENVVVQITEDLSASQAASAYSQKNIDVHYEDGTAITTSAATSGTGVEFTMGNANVEAIVNNAVGEPVMISHNIHPDSTADAYCFVSAEVQNSAGTAIQTYNPTTGIIQIPNTYINKATTDKLVITLSTNLKNDFAQFRKFTEKITGTMADLVASKASPKYTATIDNPNRKATITIDIKDLFNNDGQQIYTTLPFYSLLDKPEYKYQITYTYPAYNSNYGNYTYTAKGAFTDDELSTYMKLNGTKVEFLDEAHKATFVENKAPYVDNFMQTLTWNSDGATVGTYNTSTYTLPVSVGVNTSAPKKLTVNIKLPYVHNATYAGKYAATVDANGVGTYQTPTNEVVTGTTFEYGDWFSFTSRRSGGAEPDFIHAPDWIKKDGSNVKFRYWDVYANVDGKDNVIYTRCYDNGFNLALFTDCTLVPVYEGMAAPESDAGSATIGLMETSRNQYNNGGKGSATPAAGNYRNYADDRIYVDFLVSLNKVAISGHEADTFHEENSGKFYAGVVIEAVQMFENEDDLAKDDSYYKSTYGTKLSDISGKEAQLKTFIGGTANNKMMKYEFDATTLDNKDRARVSTNFANKKTLDANNFDLTAYTNNYKYLYRAYSYVRDTSGNIVISNTPVYFTIYDVATRQ